MAALKILCYGLMLLVWGTLTFLSGAALTFFSFSLFIMATEHTNVSAHLPLLLLWLPWLFLGLFPTMVLAMNILRAFVVGLVPARQY